METFWADEMLKWNSRNRAAEFFNKIGWVLKISQTGWSFKFNGIKTSTKPIVLYFESQFKVLIWLIVLIRNAILLSYPEEQRATTKKKSMSIFVYKWRGLFTPVSTFWSGISFFKNIYFSIFFLRSITIICYLFRIAYEAIGT